jgi:4-diphosphocytidyl-2-C-methyl-D-erythritol kinase
VVLFPNCKINLGLNILHKRSDGYHNLETIYYPLPLYDIVEAIPNRNADVSRDAELSVSGLPIAADGENNLCTKAFRLLKKDFPDMPPLKMHLHKHIPAGAGLGGGSADGAFTLLLLNRTFSLALTEEKLMNYALTLGSDCPFFIINKPCYATGRGEILEPLRLDLSSFQLMVVYPGIHINTAWAFSQLPEKRINVSSLKELPHLPIYTWKDFLKNDFETPVFAHYPEIQQIKEKLYQAGAIYASLTGSGSAVYGIFEKEKEIQAGFPENYFVKILSGSL